MSNCVRNFDAKNYKNQTTIPQLIANNMSGCFFLKHGVVSHLCIRYNIKFELYQTNSNVNIESLVA